MAFSFVTLSALIVSAAAQTSGSFSLLSYNVAGLPEIWSSGNPKVNTPLISPRLGPYNIINVQEDFNYHDALYANDSHPFRTPTSGIAGTGSGLNTLSDFPYFDLDRVKWSSCNLNGGDCLTPKGFTFARIRVRDGFWLDLYNLHGDAGDDVDDINARASNLAQLTSYIESESAGMPIVIMGDTNTRYTRIGDSESLHSLIDGLGVTDAWVSAIRGGSFPVENAEPLVCDFPFTSGTTQAEMVACEVVDKIFVRNGSAVSFESVTFTNENDAFVDDAGAPLSDHYPISSVISWTLSSSMRLGDYVGGTDGYFFNDLSSNPPAVPQISSLTIRSDSRVHSLSYGASYTFGNSTTIMYVHRGGDGGIPVTLDLDSDEYVYKMTACVGTSNDSNSIFYISFTTNHERVLSGGVITSNCTTMTTPTDVIVDGVNWGLVGFWGRMGVELYRLSAIWGAAY
ncbi:hypothetical protein E4T56_gene1998 [Termitomyces sp. T112]|nr:hypothetical protein E4T56_gene1998 [Termitomyces sp. T112]